MGVAKKRRLTVSKVYKALAALEALAECDLPHETRILVDDTHQSLFQLEGSDTPVYLR